jgi:hypothetical protein
VAVPDGTADEPEPWARRPGESGKAYQAFVCWRDLGVTRSTTEVSRQLGKGPDLIRRWKRRWDWDHRTAAWDAHLARAKDTAWVRSQTAHPDEIAAMNARHAEAALALQQKALLRLAQIDPADLTVPQTLQYLVEAVKLERAARGEAKADEAEGEANEQDVVIQLLADPDSRRLAAQLAARATGTNGRNGHRV